MSACCRDVLLIESDEVGWPAVRRAFGGIPDARVVDSIANRRDVVQRALATRPDVIITAWRIDGESIIPTLRALRPDLPGTTFIVLAENYDMYELLALGDVGISGYLLWGSLRGPRLQARLHAALWDDAVVVSSEVADAYQLAQRQRWHLSDDAVPLSERERVVLRHIAEGLIQQAIAKQLGIHVRTV